MKTKWIGIFMLGAALTFPAGAKEAAGKKKDRATGSYYYDRNRNGRMDVYENPSAPVEKRTADLLARMTPEEKAGQLLTLLGWPLYERTGDEIRLTGESEKLAGEYPAGALWGFMRADPWTQRTLVTGLNPELAARASNRLQRFVMERTRLGIPLFLAEECPHGHMAIGTTVFPTSVGQAATWNPELIRRMGRAIAREARGQGAHIGYGPVLDLSRDPRWSRVEETYGEDPYLNGVMGAALVEGFQGDSLNDGESVIATLKHFAAYGWTEGGHNGGSAHIGERELEEAVFPPFREAVAAGALSVMSAYNEIDGVPCTGNRYLLTDVLKGRWGFGGFVVSDLYAVGGLREHGVAGNEYEAVVQAANAGVDSDLGDGAYAGRLVAAVRRGDVSPETVDEAVRRILALKFRTGLFDDPFVDEKRAGRLAGSSAHIELAREVARQSIVLLKNDEGLLPLRKDAGTLAVIGPNADRPYNMLGDYTAPQASGSVVTVLEGICRKVSPYTRVLYARGCGIRDSSRAGFADALAAARQADVVILVLGGSSARDFSSEYEQTGAARVSEARISDMESGEGYDRCTLRLLGNQLELMEEIRRLGKPTVLVLIQGRPLLLEGAVQEAGAILGAWYPGMQGGHAVADVLFGDYNPAGRLTLSVPRSVGQLPVYYNTKRKGNRSPYVEGPGTPRYPFGYGLSYTTFSYTGLRVQVTEKSDDCRVEVAVTVRNDGPVDGDEVVQLYLRDEVSRFTTPGKQLRGFRRIRLKAGESREVLFTLDKKALAFYDRNGEWMVEPGRFTVMAGGSSESISLQESFAIGRKYTFGM